MANVSTSNSDSAETDAPVKNTRTEKAPNKNTASPVPGDVNNPDPDAPIIATEQPSASPPAGFNDQGITDLNAMDRDPAIENPGVGTTIGDGRSAASRLFGGSGGVSEGSPPMPPAPGSADPYHEHINTLSELPADIAALRADRAQARDEATAESPTGADANAEPDTPQHLLAQAQVQSSNLHMLLHNVGNIETMARQDLRKAARALVDTLHKLL